MATSTYSRSPHLCRLFTRFRAFRRCKKKQNVAASFVFGFAVLVLLCVLLYFVFGPRTLLAELSNYCESRVLGAAYRPPPGASTQTLHRRDRSVM